MNDTAALVPPENTILPAGAMRVESMDMDAQGIAFTQQNRLLALLAPMHRDIITVH